MNFPSFNLLRKPQVSDMQVSALRDQIETEQKLLQELSDIAHLAKSEYWAVQKAWMESQRLINYQTLARNARIMDADDLYDASLGGEIALIDRWIENVESAPARFSECQSRITELSRQMTELKG